MDTETKLQLIEGDKATRLINSDDWKWAKEKLTAIMQAMDSLQTLPKTTNEAMGEEAKARIRAQAMVLSWFQEVEGLSESAQAYRDALKQDGPPMIIKSN